MMKKKKEALSGTNFILIILSLCLLTLLQVPCGKCQHIQSQAHRRSAIQRLSGPHLRYHSGGAVLYKPINLYLIWIGNFTLSQKNTVRSFIQSLNYQDDPDATVPNWWRISTQYYDSQQHTVSSSVTVAREYSSATSSLLQYNSSADFSILGNTGVVSQLISQVIRDGKLPMDGNGIYVLFTASNIYQIGSPGDSKAKFCDDYCGWHTSFRFHSESGAPAVSLKYIWTGLADLLCPSDCLPMPFSSREYSSPAPDGGIHGLISMFAHELAEAATDPTLSSWYTQDGNECADLCSWNFGRILNDSATMGPPIGYNMQGINGSKFLVQLNWDLKTGQCSVGLDPPTAEGGRARNAGTGTQHNSTSASPPPQKPPPSPPPTQSPPPSRASPFQVSKCACLPTRYMICPNKCTLAAGNLRIPYGCFKTRPGTRHPYQCCPTDATCPYTKKT